MQIGIIGMGRMGLNMARRLLKAGHQVVGYNRTRDKLEELARHGGQTAASLAELVAALKPRRVVLLMLPAGQPVEEHLQALGGLLSSRDIVIDGGNSHFRDDPPRAESLGRLGLHYLDAGVSGGIWGLENGYCTMVGGERQGFDYIEPLLRDLAPEGGYLYAGPSGAGHFLKMVHNGIEYALMEAYAEGFELLESSPYAAGLNFREVARLWNRGSVIRSWLLELLERAFGKDPRLESLRGYVEDSGEGRWTVQQALDSGVAAPTIAQALFKRFDSRKSDLFSNRVLAALRAEFGGHAVKKS
jgi:6-phosphogluconate dehydrogenase